MTPLSTELLHASTVAIAGRAVLIEGVSGSGKSDLALRLIDRGAELVSDDYTLVKRLPQGLSAAAAPNIAGKIEVRGIGIVELPYREDMPIALLVTLSAPPERLPEPGQSRSIMGIEIPSIILAGLEASAPIKVELALQRTGENR
ncbi:HPr kinase/phosphorylase [Sphingomonas colocasiae]|uniref:HPr kinase/phosphatase C-terminal domain-containing protein n=1 Tax=Sphingomonas colocasiae TaxID=1848973 RepID=A0ABS7PJ24_9SPHN|nr:HPr kinase/phosphatase C-terminal domain-containing protein [Sphingomonas colocasiae]MBY8821305.1 HPr kinase/phosphatase C-terminal domain-containing protein [Sphingomonas colocasiae]